MWPAAGRQREAKRRFSVELAHTQDGLRRGVMVGSGTEVEGTELSDDKAEAMDLELIS